MDEYSHGRDRNLVCHILQTFTRKSCSGKRELMKKLWNSLLQCNSRTSRTVIWLRIVTNLSRTSSILTQKSYGCMWYAAMEGRISWVYDPGNDHWVNLLPVFKFNGFIWWFLDWSINNNPRLVFARRAVFMERFQLR